jgi:hypothetical protein
MLLAPGLRPLLRRSDLDRGGMTGDFTGSTFGDS